MAAKKAKGMSFADLEAALGLDEVWIASLFYGQATASADEAEKLASLLSLDPAITAAIQEFPTKGSLEPVIPTDPLIYRFYEIMQVYGMPLKDVIQEKFGDGIMSAIDFTLDVDKIEDPKGDRVQITMCGSFYPTKSGDSTFWFSLKQCHELFRPDIGRAFVCSGSKLLLQLLAGQLFA